MANKTTEKVKVGDWVMLIDPINHGQLVCVSDIYGNGYIGYNGGISSSYIHYNGEFVSIPLTEYERLKSIEERKKIEDGMCQMSRQIQKDTWLHGIELLRQRTSNQ